MHAILNTRRASVFVHVPTTNAAHPQQSPHTHNASNHHYSLPAHRSRCATDLPDDELSEMLARGEADLAVLREADQRRAAQEAAAWASFQGKEAAGEESVR